VRRLVTGVTACAALITAARDTGARRILVHHGWFLEGREPLPGRTKGRRARALVASGASLLAYHLPLDAIRSMATTPLWRAGSGSWTPQPSTIGQGLVWTGRLERPLAPNAWAFSVSSASDGPPPWSISGLPAVERWPGAPAAGRATSRQRPASGGRLPQP